MKTNIKIIATSLALTSSFGAWAGIGGLSVQSHLGQPFSGSIVVTGEEAAALQASRNVSVSGSGIRGSVTPQGNGNVVVRLRSSSPIREPIITFTVSAGRQTREYTAMLNPANYTPQPAPQHVEKPTKPTKNKTRQSANTESGERDFIERNTAKRSDVQENTLPVDDNNSTTRKSTKSAHKNNQTAQSNDANDAAVTTKQAQSVQKSGKLAVSPRRYHAKAGETLINIANRYRPRNMSTQTAARALAMANPSVFKRGSTVQHSTTLYIPTPAQWYSYAERAQYHAPANRPARQTAPRASLPVDNTQPINQAAVENTAPAAPTQPAKPVTPTAQPVTQPTQPAATPPANAKNIASPAQPNAQPVADNQTASATNKNTTTAKTTAASQPANKAAKNTQTVAASGVQAASVVAASRASAPEPITVNADPQAAPEMPVDIPAEEEIDWVVYGAGAVGVAGLLGGLAYYLRRRRTTESEADDDGDVLVVEEKPTKKSKKSKKISLGKKAAAATAVTTASTAAASEFEDEHDFDLDKENDFSKEFEALPDDDDDGVFFATENVNHSAPNDEFNLDDFKDDFESETSSFNHDSKNQSSDSNNDWYLDDNKNTTNNETEWSLDSHYDNAETHQTTTHDDNAFSAFNDDDDYFAAAPKSQPMADEFDAMLADIDNLEKEATSSSDEDDFDAMFADKLAEIDADLTPSKKTSRNADLDALNSLDDELSAFASKKTKSPAAELDDIDAMFADKLAEIDTDLAPSKKTSRNA
ncbi:type IV pilus assembly protein FimV, partial [Simonsiella muelleri]